MRRAATSSSWLASPQLIRISSASLSRWNRIRNRIRFIVSCFYSSRFLCAHMLTVDLLPRFFFPLFWFPVLAPCPSSCTFLYSFYLVYCFLLFWFPLVSLSPCCPLLSHLIYFLPHLSFTCPSPRLLLLVLIPLITNICCIPLRLLFFLLVVFTHFFLEFYDFLFLSADVQSIHLMSFPFGFLVSSFLIDNYSAIIFLLPCVSFP